MSATTTTVPDPSCSAGFEWMNNGKGQSPCELTGWLISLCVGLSAPAAIPTLTAATYNAPDSNSETPCTCSWAFYNAIQACAACQSHTPQSWLTFSSSCNFAGLSSTTSYWPQNVSLSGDTSIPRWAIVNPMKWDGSQFNVNEAQSIAQQNLPDATDATASQPSFSQSQTSAPSTSKTASSSSKPSPLGVIIGASIGAAVVLGALVGLCLYFLLRRRRARAARREPRVRLDLNGGAEAVEKLFAGEGEPSASSSFPAALPHVVRSEMGSSPEQQPVFLHRQTTAHHEFNPYTLRHDASTSTSGAGRALAGSGVNVEGLASMPSPPPPPPPAFPGIPGARGRIPSVEEQLSEKRRLRSQQRQNSNPPLAANAFFNNNSNDAVGSRRASPVRRSASVDDVNVNASTDSFGNNNNVRTGSGKGKGKGKAPARVWQNHQQLEGDDEDDGGSDEDGAGVGGRTMFLSMRARPSESVDEVIASVPGARKPTSRDRENPPPMYVHRSVSDDAASSRAGLLS